MSVIPDQRESDRQWQPASVRNVWGRYTECFNDSPEKLLRVKGITQKRLDDILEGYQKSSSIRELMMYLSPFGVTPAKVSKIQEKFGPAAVMIVKEELFGSVRFMDLDF